MASNSPPPTESSYEQVCTDPLGVFAGHDAAEVLFADFARTLRLCTASEREGDKSEAD